MISIKSILHFDTDQEFWEHSGYVPNIYEEKWANRPSYMNFVIYEDDSSEYLSDREIEERGMKKYIIKIIKLQN